MVKISPSILAADFGDLRRQIEKVETADMLHIDVMDGHFVPNISFGPGVVKSLRGSTKLFFDVHLMIENPERYIDDFVEAGADLISVHIEATKHIFRCLQYIKSCGIKAGVAINPGTPASALEQAAGLADLVLVMTVNPGFTAQKFLPEMLPKIERVRSMISDDTLLEVDGGLGISNIAQAAAAGADTIVAGASVFYDENPARAIKNLRGAVK